MMLHRPDAHVERLLKLADFLDELEPQRFSMRQWGKTQEPRCICGWFMHNAGLNEDSWITAGKLLGMDEDTATLFFQQPLRRNEISNHDAAKALRHFAVTGEFSGW
jgi:hypothetical protein